MNPSWSEYSGSSEPSLYSAYSICPYAGSGPQNPGGGPQKPQPKAGSAFDGCPKHPAAAEAVDAAADAAAAPAPPGAASYSKAEKAKAEQRESSRSSRPTKFEANSIPHGRDGGRRARPVRRSGANRKSKYFTARR